MLKFADSNIETITPPPQQALMMWHFHWSHYLAFSDQAQRSTPELMPHIMSKQDLHMELSKLWYEICE